MADDYLKRDFDKTMDVLTNSVVGHQYDREIEVLQDCNNQLKTAKGVVALTLAKRVS